MNWLEPIILRGQTVRLEPLEAHHATDLSRGINDEEIWRLMGFATLDTKEKLLAWIEAMREERQRGQGLALAIIHIASNRAVGSTSLYQALPQKRRVEIGRTWLERSMWRSAVNTESKYLLLCHAFEHLNCLRVEIKTNVRNERSQRAIERIGFQLEGRLRNYSVLADGNVGDALMYSLVPEEWPGVKTRLEQRLGQA